MTNNNTREPIENFNQLVNHLSGGCKPPDEWRIGTEHEKFAYHLDTYRPLDYGGDKGIRKLLYSMCRFGWQPLLEGENVIALTDGKGASISLEPAGQLELSGAPLETVHETCSEVTGHLQQVKAVAREMNIGFLGLGYHPKWPTVEMPWMPKNRYKIMREYMPKVGTLGLEMMKSTCTVQVNLDFSSEANMVKMFQTSLALQPIATALWANSPFKEGNLTGYLSYRSHCWTDTDPDRCGSLPFIFENGFGFERYVDYMLDVPMYFIYRNGKYIDASGLSFRDFLDGTLAVLPGEKPTIKDWEDHLSTAFPEVRLKTFLEMRGADGGPWARLCALPAFWVGLLYDHDALSVASDYIADWSSDERDALRNLVPKNALNTPFRSGSVRDIALDILEISHAGLKRRGKLDSIGLDEAHYLKPLFLIAESGITPAEEMIRAFDRRWQGNIDPVFQEYAY